MPALLTSTSIVPHSRRAESTSLSRSSRRPTSVGTASTFDPVLRNSAGGRFERVRVTGRDHEVRPGGGQARRDGQADSGRCAR